MAEAGTDAKADIARGDLRGGRSASPPDGRAPSSRRKSKVRKPKLEMDENSFQHRNISTGECCLATPVKVIIGKKNPNVYSSLLMLKF